MSFGLLNIPVKFYSPSKESRIAFRLVHKKDSQPLRVARICPLEKMEVPLSEIGRGFEYEHGKYILLGEEDFEKANIRKFRTIDILQFSKKEDVESKYFADLFFLEPEKESQRAYVLLKDALRKTGKVGVGKVVIRNREYVVILETSGDTLILNRLRYAQSAYPPADILIPGEETSSNEELNMAVALIDQLTRPFDIKVFRDTYSDELRRIISDKIQGRTLETKGEKPKTTPMSELVNALKKSLDLFK